MKLFPAFKIINGYGILVTITRGLLSRVISLFSHLTEVVHRRSSKGWTTEERVTSARAEKQSFTLSANTTNRRQQRFRGYRAVDRDKLLLFDQAVVSLTWYIGDRTALAHPT